MIRGIHGLFYSSDADATQAFVRDKLKLPFSDVGDGWLIFDLPEGDLGVHPLDDSGNPDPGTHDISFYCDDIQTAVAELRARGVHFKSEVADHGYGFVTYFTMPGGVEVQLYEPKYRKRAGRSKATVKTAPRASARGKHPKTATKRRGSRTARSPPGFLSPPQASVKDRRPSFRSELHTGEVHRLLPPHEDFESRLTSKGPARPSVRACRNAY